jgi:hypothetical protein
LSGSTDSDVNSRGDAFSINPVPQASDPFEHAPLAPWLALSVDNMKTSLCGREPLDGAAEPGRDFVEIDVFDLTKSVRAKNRCNTSGLETAGRTFIDFLELFGPLGYQFPHLF